MQKKLSHFILLLSVLLVSASCLNKMVYRSSGKSGAQTGIALGASSIFDEKFRFDNYKASYPTGTNPRSVFATDLDGDAELISAEILKNRVPKTII